METKSRIIAIAAVATGALALMLAMPVSTQYVPASAISLHDDAATIAAADAAKYEVIRRQQEEARIAQMTRQAIAEATRQEQSRIAEATRQEQARVAQETRTARDVQATENARNAQTTATAQVAFSRTLELSATAAALAKANTQATATAQVIEAERIARAQAAEAARMANEAYQRRAMLQQVGAVVLFAISIALCMAVVRGLWKIGKNAQGKQPASAPEPESVQAESEPPEIVIVDDPSLTATMVEMWNQSEPR